MYRIMVVQDHGGTYRIMVTQDHGGTYRIMVTQDHGDTGSWWHRIMVAHSTTGS